MNFLKTFFNDNSIKIGLCGFSLVKRNYDKSIFSPAFIPSNPFQREKNYKTNFENNIFLST